MRNPALVRSVRRGGYRILFALSMLSLAACGGGGGGGGGSTTFSVGGTITGLSASGLVLQDNGGDNLTVSSGATSFTFATQVASGASYKVTVLTQPTGETCTVSSGTGTITANVTNVMVSCSASTFTVSGTITGLSASGLVLQDNGGDNLTVSSGATSFTFATQVASGASYKVTVLTQPTGETCTVSSGTGTITANVTNVMVSCSASTFTVSGTITGLSNAGLKLQDYSGGETLSVSAGATKYQFTQSVSYGTNVQVTVTAQPSLQTCTAGASNFSGPITSNITTDTFSCTTLTATVITFAGSTTAGSTDGTGTTASFHGPIGVAVDSSGNVYVADSANNKIRKITSAGDVTTLAGTGTAGNVNGTGTVAEFNYPTGVAVDASGNVYVADFYNNEIRKIVCTGSIASTCTVTTLAGSGTAGHTDGTGSTASFYNPSSVAVDSSGNVYVADYNNNEIREVTPAGVVTTVAGSTTAGHADGSGTSASFNGPAGVAVDSSGNVYVADYRNDEIRMINSSDVVSTLAGSTTAGHSDGQGSSASFNGPNDVAVDSAGNVYVADANNNEIRLVAPTGLVSTLAGSTTAGSANGTGGTGGTARFNSPSGVGVNATGDVFVGDLGNNEIREIEP